MSETVGNVAVMLTVGKVFLASEGYYGSADGWQLEVGGFASFLDLAIGRTPINSLTFASGDD